VEEEYSREDCIFNLDLIELESADAENTTKN
jgi:hypothetical protein